MSKSDRRTKHGEVIRDFLLFLNSHSRDYIDFLNMYDKIGLLIEG